jgi:hypothetical protein
MDFYLDLLSNKIINRMSDDDRVNEVLIKWQKAKDEIKFFQEKCDKYREFIKNVMDKEDTNVLSRKDFVISRRHDSRRTLSKSNVPEDIWNRFSTVTYYDTYNLKKKK